jgi:hypothetical protein
MIGVAADGLFAVTVQSTPVELPARHMAAFPLASVCLLTLVCPAALAIISAFPTPVPSTFRLAVKLGAVADTSVAVVPVEGTTAGLATVNDRFGVGAVHPVGAVAFH